MIIKKINIEKYGKLKNFTVTFNKGMNVIYGENEAGKSTLQSFIKSMFYGMNSKKKNIKENDRKKYLPWGEETASGEIYYEYKKKEYIIRRTFGGTKRNDSIEVKDAITGKDINLSDNYSPGIDIFGLGEEAFEKTIFIRQMGSMVVRDKEDEIMGKLINLKQTGDENVSYHKAISSIENKEKQIQNSRRTGKLDSLQQRLQELNSEFIQSIRVHEENMEKQLKCNEVKRRKNEIQNEIKVLEKSKQNIKKLQTYKEYKEIEKYLNNINILTEEKNDIDKKLKNQDVTVDYNFIDKIKDEYSKWIQIKKQIEDEKWELQNKQIALVNLKQVCEKIHKEIADREQKIKNLKENTDVNNTKIENLILRRDIIKDRETTFKFISIIGGLLIGIIGAIVSSKFIGILSIIGLIIGSYGMYNIKNNFNKIDKLEQKIHSLKDFNKTNSEIDSLTSSLSDLYSKLKYLESKEFIISKLQEESNEKIIFIVDNLSRAKGKRIAINEVKQTINQYIEIINSKIKIENDMVSSKNVYKALLKGRDFNTIKQLVENLEIENEKNLDEEKIEEEIKSKNKELFSLEKELVNTNNKIENAFNNFRNKSEIEEEIKEVEEEIKKYNEYREILNIASSAIEQSFIEVQQSFGPKLNQKVAEVMKKITKGKYSEVKISEDYDINLTESEKSNIKELDYFSSGTIDQMYFALRIGIIELVSNEKVPLFLDDTFVQYDDTRLNAAIQYIYEYSRDNQVIILTCQKREEEKLKFKDDVNIIKI